MGVSFHVGGNACGRPPSRRRWLNLARPRARRGLFADGGWAAVFRLSIRAWPAGPRGIHGRHRWSLEGHDGHETTELWCEPAAPWWRRAAPAGAAWNCAKGDALYLNDSSYGNLFDAAVTSGRSRSEAVAGRGAKPRGKQTVPGSTAPPIRGRRQARSSCRKTCAGTSRSAC